MRKPFDFAALRLTAATSAALLAGACNGSGVADQPTRVCIDPVGRRVADADCRRSSFGGGAHGYYYLGRGRRVPDVGEVATGGSTRPSRGVSYFAAPEGVSRGGFGRSLGFHGFGHG